MSQYLIGQRVIVNNSEICKVTYSKDKLESLSYANNTWVERPNGVIQWYANHNVKPLPGGQL